MSLEAKSQALKALIATYDTDWLLGDLSGLMRHISTGHANDQLGKLSSPLRQLYFLGGLLITSDDANADDIRFTHEKWNEIVVLLNEIEAEYDKFFFPRPEDTIDEQWRQVREVAMPSFLGYFNQGPLNYEEQTVNWISDLFTPLDTIIEAATSLKTADFINFYDALDALIQQNMQGIMTKFLPVKPNWRDYSKVKLVNTAPPWLEYKPSEDEQALYQFMADHGIINRFFPAELVSADLPEDKINAILSLLSISRASTDYLYYTSANPLLEKPIINLGTGMFQVFEIKQVIHATQDLLERVCTTNTVDTKRYTDRKGKLLESRVIEIFSAFFKKDCQIFPSYYIDGNEQDILILWKKYAFIIEPKGYALREPLRDPDRAFPRIKKDFEASIGYGYAQTKRVEQKFIDGVPFYIYDEKGNKMAEIDPSKYEADFSIIVNLKSFGQIQNDLSTLLPIGEDDVYPWAVKLDDLEVFLLTMQAQGKKPLDFVAFLSIREELHGKLICMDELDVCAMFLEGKLSPQLASKQSKLLVPPDEAGIFDKQYAKGMGFKNEKYWAEKKGGKHLFI
ncbi:hypothetical protein FNT36_20760 [Hymenobacter setariae]|uniref:NERD domain-containing protein n=1 Tax=Hymenobacter setariae TaxID=2594794 RepID=A0A558BQ59_9BACT|nr:hypothetical protein [Hymenobacter setariae]TVT38613.1 hypothetical protein FNT36_20760 [Hymenobacter setariae]